MTHPVTQGFFAVPSCVWPLGRVVSSTGPGVTREQAHVPAEQPPSREDAWLPAAHADQGRARGAGRPAPQGPVPGQRLTRPCTESLVLPAASRMGRRRDFSLAVRQGSRASRELLTGHLFVPPGDQDIPPRAGFVVSRAVGIAVVRNRVRRRLRPLVREYLSSLPGGSLLVVRAHPSAATARQADLAAELDLVMDVLMRQQVGVERR